MSNGPFRIIGGPLDGMLYELPLEHGTVEIFGLPAPLDALDADATVDARVIGRYIRHPKIINALVWDPEVEHG